MNKLDKILDEYARTVTEHGYMNDSFNSAKQAIQQWALDYVIGEKREQHNLIQGLKLGIKLKDVEIAYQDGFNEAIEQSRKRVKGES